jgi:hypothetical protein
VTWFNLEIFYLRQSSTFTLSIAPTDPGYGLADHAPVSLQKLLRAAKIILRLRLAIRNGLWEVTDAGMESPAAAKVLEEAEAVAKVLEEAQAVEELGSELAQEEIRNARCVCRAGHRVTWCCVQSPGEQECQVGTRRALGTGRGEGVSPITPLNRPNDLARHKEFVT